MTTQQALRARALLTRYYAQGAHPEAGLWESIRKLYCKLRRAGDTCTRAEAVMRYVHFIEVELQKYEAA